MKNQKFTVNMGYCQGVIQGNVFRQKNSVAKFNVAVRSDRKNPKTNKKEVHVLNFTMYGEAAESLHLLCGDRDRVFVAYHLESRVKVNRKTGIGECVEEYVADSVIVRNIGDNDRLPTLNRGYLECEFLDITEMYNATGIYVLNVRGEDKINGNRMFTSFVIYSTIGDKIREYYKKGRRIMVEYKIEKSKRELPDGRNEFFTNRVVERIS